ncbi:unnamed protein product [Caenorhabditis angaria]|uniref:receptor protein serine/threonine kinase n=1 Tax=Caenorhabditis angaria TaxID=860376 RepID=A0A9P1IBM1_9PELO|nr:unnamed protein product [Caenorhabditis angaria]
MMRLFIFIIFLLNLKLCETEKDEWDIYDDENLALSIPSDAQGKPKEFRDQVLMEMRIRAKPRDVPENHCYCNYGPLHCDSNYTCIKHDKAACFHSIEEKYNKQERRMETWHKFGCASLERGSQASHLQCNQWRTTHQTPRSIACCYEGNYCNRDIEPPSYANIFHNEKPSESHPPLLSFKDGLKSETGIFLFILLALIIILTFAIFFLLSIAYYRRKNIKKASKTLSNMTEKEMLYYEDSGSGSEQATLLQRTVRQDLSIIKTIGQGRYGEVRKAAYRGRFVAVKTFYTTDEDSWKNERDVYQTHMINHENILQFVAADIWSEEDSMTKMLLVVDYHELGSLSDYLRREQTLTTDEALRLIHSCICGIEHLHTAVQGTGNYRKPEIAHRDIKSKNIIVKRAGVCCIADLGLALRCDIDYKILPEKFNVQVGTKRYMAPELLRKTLDPSEFAQFKMADIYSMSLVMWEVARRVEDTTAIGMINVDETLNDRSESSGLGDSVSSDGGVRVHRQKASLEVSLKAKPYMPPFDGVVEFDPSFEQMLDVVCVKGLRPPIENEWVKGNNIALCQLSQLMRDSWHMNPHYRHTALKLKKELNKLIDLVDKMNRGHKTSITKNMSQDADSGI